MPDWTELDLPCQGEARKFLLMANRQEQQEQQGQREGIQVHRRIGSWAVTLWWPSDAVSGGPRAIYVEQAEDGDSQEIARGISSTTLRQIDIAEASEGVFDVLAKIQSFKSDLGDSREIYERLSQGGITDLYLAVLAAQYVKIVDLGKRAPIKDLSMWSGKNEGTLKGHLREARKRGILTKVDGKAGGQLTEKAESLLEELKNGNSSEEVRLQE